MAATGTPTPNLGLRIPQGTDPASVDDINYNSNLLDTKLGAVGNDSVQDQIDALNSNLATRANVTASFYLSTSGYTGTLSGDVSLVVGVYGNYGFAYIVHKNSGRIPIVTSSDVDLTVGSNGAVTLTNSNSSRTYRTRIVDLT